VRALLPQSQSHNPKCHMLLQSAMKALYHIAPNPGAVVLPILGALASSLAGAPLAPPAPAAAPRCAEDAELQPAREECGPDEGSLCERLMSMQLLETTIPGTPAVPLAFVSDGSPSGMNTGGGGSGATAAASDLPTTERRPNNIPPGAERTGDESATSATLPGSPFLGLACRDVLSADATVASFFTVLGMVALEQLRLTERTMMRLRRGAAPSLGQGQLAKGNEREGGGLADVTADGAADFDDIQVPIAALAWLAVVCSGRPGTSYRGHSWATFS
jgi:hypothetical protein